jgi:hypothetical protein
MGASVSYSTMSRRLKYTIAGTAKSSGVARATE